MERRKGQRYLFVNYSGSFVGEVEDIDDTEITDVRIVQVINWTMRVGHLYTRCHLEDGCWTYLPGQDKP